MGRSTREGARANRERVLDQAARRLKERGINGVGVADLMAAAGLTHGGFYRHFASKEALAAEAVARAARAGAADWAAMGAKARAAGRPSALPEIVDAYLSEDHRAALAEGCAIAGLGGELVRLPKDLREDVVAAVEGMVEVLAAEMPEANESGRRRGALISLSTMVGALVLARLGVGTEDDLLELAARRVKGADGS